MEQQKEQIEYLLVSLNYYYTSIENLVKIMEELFQEFQQTRDDGLWQDIVDLGEKVFITIGNYEQILDPVESFISHPSVERDIKTQIATEVEKIKNQKGEAEKKINIILQSR